eukprot:scaffold133758_cov105-Phaeocystis_antarctica.AAC.1
MSAARAASCSGGSACERSMMAAALRSTPRSRSSCAARASRRASCSAQTSSTEMRPCSSSRGLKPKSASV